MNMKRTSAYGDWLILLYKTTFYVQEAAASVADLASQNAGEHKKAPPLGEPDGLVSVPEFIVIGNRQHDGQLEYVIRHRSTHAAPITLCQRQMLCMPKP